MCRAPDTCARRVPRGARRTDTGRRRVARVRVTDILSTLHQLLAAHCGGGNRVKDKISERELLKIDNFAKFDVCVEDMLMNVSGRLGSPTVVHVAAPPPFPLHSSSIRLSSLVSSPCVSSDCRGYRQLPPPPASAPAAAVCADPPPPRVLSIVHRALCPLYHAVAAFDGVASAPWPLLGRDPVDSLVASWDVGRPARGVGRWAR